MRENDKNVEKVESNVALDSTHWPTQPGSQIEGLTTDLFGPK